MRDITEPMIARSLLVKELAEIEAKAAGFPGIKTCDIKVSRIAGKVLEPGRYHIELDAQLAIATAAFFKLSLASRGDGVLEDATRTLLLNDVRVTNDTTGLATRLIGFLGFGKGRGIKVKRADRELIAELLA